MNACSSACGYCGRCTTAEPERQRFGSSHLCARPGCDRTLNMFRVTVAGIGQFCSRRCADAVIGRDVPQSQMEEVRR